MVFGITPNKHTVCLLCSSDDLKKRPVRTRLADIDHITFVKWAAVLIKVMFKSLFKLTCSLKLLNSLSLLLRSCSIRLNKRPNVFLSFFYQLFSLFFSLDPCFESFLERFLVFRKN